jgi:hypothetical protein
VVAFQFCLLVLKFIQTEQVADVIQLRRHLFGICALA